MGTAIVTTPILLALGQQPKKQAKKVKQLIDAAYQKKGK